MNSLFARKQGGQVPLYLVLFVLSSPCLSADERLTNGDLKKLSLAHLAEQLDTAPRPHRRSDDNNGVTFEAVLSEILRRRGDAAEKILADKLADQESRLKVVHEALAARTAGDADKFDQINNLDELTQNLELVTALRRIQMQPDPLKVIVEQPAGQTAGTRVSPVFEVTLKNVDTEKTDIGLQFGGDYRSGRHARWRIHVWDSEGNLLPEAKNTSWVGGGIYRLGSLAYGETWQAELPLFSYTRIFASGKYKVQVLYHNSEKIADNPKHLDSPFVFRSEPFEFTLEDGPKIPIRVSAESMKIAVALIKSFVEKDPIRILLTKYDERTHDFIDPKSAQGAILAMQWQAVPALLNTLEDENISFRKRAWILALLFSITRERELSPMSHGEDQLPRGVLPDYETRGSDVTQVNWNGGASYGWTGDGKRKGGPLTSNCSWPWRNNGWVSVTGTWIFKLRNRPTTGFRCN